MNVVTSINEYFGKVPIAIWVIDEVSMRFLAVNNALLTMYGYSEEDFLAMTISDIVVSDSPSAGVAYFITDTGECSRHKRKNGTAFYVRILSQEVSFNDIPARLCYVLDIDNKVVEEQKNAELLLQLKYQKERIDNILLSVNDGIWSRRADNFDLIYGNSAYFQLYGLSPEGQNNGIEQLQKSVFPTDLEQVNSAIRQVLSASKSPALPAAENSPRNRLTVKSSRVSAHCRS